MKKRKPKMEFRYYKIPADSHMLPLTGENLKQCYGVEVDYLHFHNHMEIGYCYYGEGTLSLENTKHEFQGGMFSIIPRNFPHTTNSKLNTISSWEYLFLDVSSIISQFHQANPILSDKKLSRQINKKASFLSEKDYPFTGQLIRRLLALAKEHPVYYKEEADGLLSALMMEIARMNQSDTLESGEHEADKLTALLLNVVDYISIHYPDNISVKDLADRCFITENHFRKVFTAYMKMSPARYINLVRIQMACALLQMSNDLSQILPIKQALKLSPPLTEISKKYLVFSPGNGETIPKIMNASFWNTISRQKKDGNAQKK